jgi:hypothetical protein
MNQKRKTLLFPSLIFVLSIAMIFSLALAGSNSTTLPNGAELEVSIDDPVTSTEFNVPPGQPTIDVDVTGTASVGQGIPNVTLVYVIDVSASTLAPCGTDSDTILDCEKSAILGLNSSPGISSVDEVGVVVYGETGAAADMTPGGGDDPITAPDAGPGDVDTVVNSVFTSSTIPCPAGVAQFTNKNVGCDGTDYSAGLASAKTVVDASTNGINLVIFLSDGLSNQEDPPGFDANLAALAGTGAVVHSFAVGSGSSCVGGANGTLQEMADATGGSCTPVPDPANLPDILPDLISTTLESLEIEVNGGGKQVISNDDISPDLPAAGPVSADYLTTVTGLGPADHDICVTATGSDNAGADSVEQCETIHLLQLTATPDTETNDLNVDNGHTVTAAIIGGTGPDRDIDFAVGGQNAATATPANASINATPGGASVDFSYTVPQDCASLGTDTITVSTTIATVLASIDVTKDWVDPVPPDVSCDPTVNPHGNKEPQAPGKGGQGRNQDGFYQLNAEDPNLANCTVTLQVVDGDGFVFPGPFLPGDKIKYTQDDFIPQEQKKIGSGNDKAGAVLYHLIGHGDLSVTGTDPSGNTTTDTCFVPPPPK